MSFGANQNDFNVFASAWNPDSIATAEFYFNITEPLPANTLLNFEIEITNLTPSSADTCFFAQQFTVNLNPDNPLNLNHAEHDALKIYPNPAHDRIVVSLPESMTFDYFDIISIDGKSVMTSSKDFNKGPIDISFLRNGMYSIRLWDKYQFKTGKFVKN